MKRSELKRRTPLRAHRNGIGTPTRVKPATSQAQRTFWFEHPCLVTGDYRGVTLAHVIDRSLTTVGQDDPLAVIPLRIDKHTEYDDHRLDLLPYLADRYDNILAFAVRRVGLITTLERVTGLRWRPE